jgi:hypothetical protein
LSSSDGAEDQACQQQPESTGFCEGESAGIPVTADLQVGPVAGFVEALRSELNRQRITGAFVKAKESV